MILAHLAVAAPAAHAASSPSSNTWIIDATFFGGGLLPGRVWGWRTGLKHLGKVEFNTRWRNVRGLRRF
jgi:hypothetical protein